MILSCDRVAQMKPSPAGPVGGLLPAPPGREVGQVGFEDIGGSLVMCTTQMDLTGSHPTLSGSRMRTDVFSKECISVQGALKIASRFCIAPLTPRDLSRLSAGRVLVEEPASQRVHLRCKSLTAAHLSPYLEVPSTDTLILRRLTDLTELSQGLVLSTRNRRHESGMLQSARFREALPFDLGQQSRPIIPGQGTTPISGPVEHAREF